MKKFIISVACSFVILILFFIAINNNRSNFGVDAVSAATVYTKKPANNSTTNSTKKPANNSTTGSVKNKSPQTLTKSNNDVRLIQALLNNFGYKLKVDGVYGKLTVNAIKGFQKENGLKVDGIVGTKTYALLKTGKKTSQDVNTTITKPNTINPTNNEIDDNDDDKDDKQNDDKDDNYNDEYGDNG